MGSSSSFRLKRLGSLKIFVVLEDGTDQAGKEVKAGSVVIFRRNAKRPSVYETIYDAWRSRMEIVGRYGPDGRKTGEIAELAETRQRIQAAGLDLLDEDAGAAGGRLTRRIGRVAKDLKYKSNPFKSEARLKARSGPVRTSRNRRINRLATQSRVEAIDSRLAERQEEVYAILPWMKAMEMALCLEIDRSLGVVERLAKDIGAMISGHRFFTVGQTTPQQLRGIAARLKLIRRDAATLLAEPFLGFGRSVICVLDQAVSQVEAGNADKVQEYLGRIIVGSDRILLQRVVEDLISHVAMADITGCSADFWRRLRQRTDFLLKLCSDADMAGSYIDVAAQLRSDSDQLLRCMLAAGHPGQYQAHLDEYKQSLKQISRRLAQ
jgi:hypothetical protein